MDDGEGHHLGDPPANGGLHPDAGASRALPAPAAHAARAYSELDELGLLRFMMALDAQLRPTRDLDRLLKIALRQAGAFFNASLGCVACVEPGSRTARLVVSDPRAASWNLEMLSAFARGERPPVEPGLMLARLRRRRRAWGVFVLRHGGGVPSSARREALNRVAGVINECIAFVERERSLDVRTRIDRKILVQIRPQDLFYQILDGLRSLTGYDHSAALFIGDEDDTHFDLVAEQIAWRKGKSARIGRRAPMSAGLRDAADSAAAGGHSDIVWGMTRGDGGWTPWAGSVPRDLAGLVEYPPPDHPDPPTHALEHEILCAPLRLRGGPLAMLKVSALHAGSFGPYEAELLAAFMPQASVALQNSRRTESLHAKMLETERKHAMAEFARGVAHDVNNAMGAALPLVQQLREELEEGRADPKRLAADLAHIERSIQACRRIFGGMVGFARRAARPSGDGELRAALESALALLADGLARRKIDLVDHLPRHLPRIRVSQHEIDQVFFNLLSNARDAMPEGGRLTVEARPRQDGHIVVEIADTGCGIPRELISRVLEPFFTTKPNGNGLGLSVCRDIVWAAQGHLALDSVPGSGTTVRLTLPASEPAPDRALVASGAEAGAPPSPDAPQDRTA